MDMKHGRSRWKRRNAFGLLRTNTSEVVENSTDKAADSSASLKMAGMESELLCHIKSRKLQYFGYVMSISHDNTEASVMTSFVEGVRNCGRPRTCWVNITAWPFGSESATHHTRQRALVGTNPSRASCHNMSMLKWHDITRHQFW